MISGRGRTPRATQRLMVLGWTAAAEATTWVVTGALTAGAILSHPSGACACIMHESLMQDAGAMMAMHEALRPRSPGVPADPLTGDADAAAIERCP